MGGSVLKILIVKMFMRLQTHTYTCTRPVNKVMRLPAYRTIWQYLPFT